MNKQTRSSKAGVRVGDWFLWIDCEVVKTQDYARYPLVRLRKAISGGDVITSVVGSLELASSLRKAADNIESMVLQCEDDNGRSYCEEQNKDGT